MARGTHGNHAKGPDHYTWKPGGSVSSHGYVKTRVGEGHPLADPNGYAYEHLVVWVSAGNPRPPKGWLLHHKNECKTDNRLSNLELKKRGAHKSDHIKAASQRDPSTGKFRKSPTA